MTGETGAPQRSPARPGVDAAAVARLGAGLVILGAGLWAAGRTAWWYALDELQSGAYLRDPGAVWLPAFVSGVIVVVGVAVLVMRRRVVGTRMVLGLGALAAVCVLGAVLAVKAEPRIEHARVTALAPGTSTPEWTVAVPLVVVSGVVSATDETITVGGTAMDHGCRDSRRGVTLDRDTGDVVEVVELPGSYPGAVSPVGGEEPLADHGLVAERGELPFVCQN